MDDSVDENSPWLVQGMDDFLHYNCPECPFKHKNLHDFWSHAVQAHPGCKAYLDKIFGDHSKIKQEDCDIKEEPVFDDVLEPESVLDQDLREADPYQCYVCGQSLPKDGKIVYDHLVSNHGKYSEKMFGQPRNFQCGDCGKMLDKGAKLKSHVKKKHNGKVSHVTISSPGSIIVCQPKDRDQTNQTGPNKINTRSNKIDKDEDRGFVYEEIEYEDPPWISDPENFPPVCDPCGKTFTEKLCLRRHYKTVHLNHKPYKCNSCNFACFSQGPMKVHVETHRKQHTCDMCNKRFSSKNFQIHLDKAHKTNSTNVIERKPVSDNKATGKEVKGYTIQKVKYVDPPWIVSPESYPHPCVPCGQTFNDKRHLRHHYQRIHLKLLPFKCNTCSFACFSQRTMKFHIESHVDASDREHLCTICGQRYGHEQMKVHKLNAHKTMGDYTCNVCKSVFGNAKQLLVHHRLEHPDAQLVVEGRDAFKCSQCDRVFTRNKGLQSHVKKVHLEMGKIQCDMCGLTVTTKFGLHQHKANVHGSDVQFSCGECGKKFAHKSTYERHKEKVHGDASVQCQECDGVFKHVESLRLHVNTVHKKHLHSKCPCCTKTFAKRYKNRMTDHIREKHPGKVVEQVANDV